MFDKLKQLDRRMVTILLIVFVQLLGASMVLPILPLYAERQFELSPRTITLLVSAFFAAQFVASPVLGRLSDRFGRVPVLIISQIGTVISFVMLAVAPNFAWLFASRILDGITGGNILVAQAYITDITPKARRTQSLGLIFAAFGLGFIFGPALGGVLSAAFGARIPFLLAAAAAGGVVLLTWFTLDESLTKEQRLANSSRGDSLRLGRLVRNRPLVTLLALAFVVRFALGLLQSTFALYGSAVLFTGFEDRFVNLGVGLLLSVVGLSQFITQTVLLDPLLQRFKEPTLVLWGNVGRTLGMFGFAIFASPWAAALACIFFAVGGGVMTPSLQSLATGTVDDEVRGGLLGIYNSALSLATIAGTALGGFLFEITPTTPYWLGAILSAIIILPALLLRQPEPAGAEDPSLALNLPSAAD